MSSPTKFFLLDFTHNPNTISEDNACGFYKKVMKPTDQLQRVNSQMEERLEENLTLTTQLPEIVSNLPCIQLIKDFHSLMARINEKKKRLNSKSICKVCGIFFY